MEVRTVSCHRDPSVHGVARGVSFPWDTAKHALEDVQERFDGVVDGFDCFWLFAHYQHGFPELALRDPGVDCGVVLWLDLAEEWIDLRVRDRSWASGCNLAFLVPDSVSDIMQSPCNVGQRMQIDCRKSGNAVVTSGNGKRLSACPMCPRKIRMPNQVETILSGGFNDAD